MSIIKEIRKTRPIIHCITNIVTVNDCANILLAAGASPIMAHHPAEVEEVTTKADCLVCNMGALENYEAMEIAMEAAKRAGHPIVIDPVGVSGSTYRREKCISLIKRFQPTCVRGNYSEILALMKECNTAAGLDGGIVKDEISRKSDLVRQIEAYAKRQGVIVIASGKTDIVTDGSLTELVTDGHPMMRRITGSGCMSSVLVGAFLTVKKDTDTAAAACRFIGKAGEKAAQETIADGGGTMTFRLKFIDEVSKADMPE
ncbi:MAG: hydroxyethylthiazole kinase [Lachnospiraceae bacterium]|nr:hydroxyethylthiazole kinase [Lachnospiraceae bacterium]